MSKDGEDTALPGIGIVHVSTDLIREWMLLPAGFDIVNAQMDANGWSITFTVKHQRVPISPDGAVIPTFTPIFETKRDEDGTAWYRLLKISISE